MNSALSCFNTFLFIDSLTLTKKQNYLFVSAFFCFCIFAPASIQSRATIQTNSNTVTRL